MQGQGLNRSPLCGVQGLAGDEALLLTKQLHISSESDDVPLRLRIALWAHEQQPAQHRRQRQVQP